jgi:hypothetical protein
MKALGLWLCIWVAALAPVSAQVTVEVIQDQDAFLPAEAMPTAVRITNRSGQSLRLGREPDWLTFSVQSRGDEVVPKLGDVPVVDEFVLESSRVATKRVDLAPYFSLTHSGHYAVIATVRIKDWNQDVTSPPRNFDIIEGAKLWEQEFGVPNSVGPTNATPEVRKFILQQANYLKAQLRLYLRLTDASGSKTFRVFPIGPMLSFSRPEAQLDKFSNLHLLYQDAAHSFRYTVVSPDGEILARQVYDYVDKRPRLQPDMDGKILIAGGVRRVTPSDVPTPKPVTPAEEAPKPLPSPGELMPPNP